MIEQNIFAGKLSEMRVTPGQCGWVHIYGNTVWMEILSISFLTMVLIVSQFHVLGSNEFQFS